MVEHLPCMCEGSIPITTREKKGRKEGRDVSATHTSSHWVCLWVILTICSWFCGELVAPFNIHCKFCSPMTRLDCRIAVLGVGVMVMVGLLVRTELAPRGRVRTIAGRGSVVLCGGAGAATADATAAAAAGAPATTESPGTMVWGGAWGCGRNS